MKTEASSHYIPGTCNIGRDEIKVRRNNAIIMGTVTVVLTAALLLLNLHKLWRLILIVPAAAFANGLQQWYFQFCVYFGMKGLFNFGEQGNTSNVELEEMRKKDLAKARRMIVVSVVFGVLFSLGIYLI